MVNFDTTIGEMDDSFEFAVSPIVVSKIGEMDDSFEFAVFVTFIIEEIFGFEHKIARVPVSAFFTLFSDIALFDNLI